jgi:hypothetical protein
VTARRSLLIPVSLASVLAACGGSPQPVPPAAPKPPMATPGPAAPGAPATAAVKPPGAALEVTAPEIPKYEAKGRRDPFETLEIKEGAAGSTVAAARLTGIVRSSNATLALVETPEGIGYILKPGDTLGDGRLLEIGSDSVVFQVTPKPGVPTNRVVLKLATN